MSETVRMSICAWRWIESDYPEDALEVNIAVKGERRSRQLSDQLLAMTPGSSLRLKLVMPPVTPAEHRTFESRVMNSDDMNPFTSMEIWVGSEPSPLLTAQMGSNRLILGVPQIMLAEFASLISEQRALTEHRNVKALISDSPDDLREGVVQLWTWNDEGILYVGY